MIKDHSRKCFVSSSYKPFDFICLLLEKCVFTENVEHFLYCTIKIVIFLSFKMCVCVCGQGGGGIHHYIVLNFNLLYKHISGTADSQKQTFKMTHYVIMTHNIFFFISPLLTNTAPPHHSPDPIPSFAYSYLVCLMLKMKQSSGTVRRRSSGWPIAKLWLVGSKVQAAARLSGRCYL